MNEYNKTETDSYTERGNQQLSEGEEWEKDKDWGRPLRDTNYY